jgi:bis(5'-nucleosyl)-tetraphosphatase (symmetrical)
VSVATYVVGDIQGCYDPLRRLLDSVHFDADTDRLWAVGDLVNRGPRSLEVMRFLRGLGERFTGVLGNHDLHLLAVHFGARPMRTKDTLSQVLAAPDRAELIDWLRNLPLAHHDRGLLMVHAGVVPDWTLTDTLDHAAELSAVLRGSEVRDFLTNMYGNTPDTFRPDLVGWPRLRVITNVLTRLRFCSAAGRLDLDSSDAPERPPPGMLPWYRHRTRKTREVPIVFGHWAALGGALHEPTLYALDTGCVWGQALTVLRLEDKKRFSCDCAG